jgi:DNA invertase Pin-like site-specific DNA recombinase
MLIGYARVSTVEQNPAHQVDALRRSGVEAEDIHIDVASGAKSSRPKLDLAMKLLRGGDTLVVTRLDRLDRLGRSGRCQVVGCGGGSESGASRCHLSPNGYSV